jgi:hypothetical protein
LEVHYRWHPYFGRKVVSCIPPHAQATQSQQPPPKDTVGKNYDRTLVETWPTCMPPLLQLLTKTSRRFFFLLA